MSLALAASSSPLIAAARLLFARVGDLPIAAAVLLALALIWYAAGALWRYFRGDSPRARKSSRRADPSADPDPGDAPTAPAADLAPGACPEGGSVADAPLSPGEPEPSLASPESPAPANGIAPPNHTETSPGPPARARPPRGELPFWGWFPPLLCVSGAAALLFLLCEDWTMSAILLVAEALLFLPLTRLAAARREEPRHRKKHPRKSSPESEA